MLDKIYNDAYSLYENDQSISPAFLMRKFKINWDAAFEIWSDCHVRSFKKLYAERKARELLEWENA
ncbi:MAG TPA: hypothetical protein VKZ95_08750 [Sphingobacteriaceae bacterium]|nr:hypothetical protein [Sphingobacteriaceae bacterium]